ncbi:MAG: NrdH-redoxin [Lysobacterales bacterium CG17_big_fil_post_rev_8_21_14_2_50_64_11]|nr:MAG: NrdH-redoxin [Xanthomonadales bacterium CG17_big_fil_post_rev_8_21_14_2_50_64_11]PIX60748.1 MAG: NrdH-redoxin [Xanthomonadales bacterium CG_4_10_14_3_um_filter_64_11]
MLILYQRDDCHLCDRALLELARAGVSDFNSVFIDTNADLEARYGTRIPVLHDHRNGRELGWPFDAARVRQFLSGERRGDGT